MEEFETNKKNAKLLIIGNTRSQQKLFKEGFEEKGYQVIIAPTGSQGVSLAFSEHPDLIILDSTMPEISGYVLCRLIKNEPAIADIPVILLTVKDEDKDRFWALKSGADHYLSKHADFDELHQVVRFILKEMPHSEVKVSFSSTNPSQSLDSAIIHLLNNLLRESVLYVESLNMFNLVYYQDKLFLSFFDLLSKVLEIDYAVMGIYERRKPVKILFHSRLPISQPDIDQIKRHWTEMIGISDDQLLLIEKQDFVINELWDSSIETEDEIGLASEQTTALPDNKGLVTIYSQKPDLYNDDSKTILNIVANNFSMALELMNKFKESKNQSIMDDVTGAFNSQYFKVSLDTVVSEAARYNTPLSLLLIDIDYFDTLVGTFGEQQGEETLKEMAGVLKSALRNSDILARVDNHLFAAILTHTNLAGGLVAAERIRGYVERDFAPSASRPFRLTLSMGIVEYSEEIKGAGHLYECAMDALKQSSLGGGNQVSQ